MPAVLVLVYVVVYGSAFATVPWPFVDVYGQLYEAGRWTWAQAIPDAFSREVEYRPFFTLGVKAAYHLLGLRLGLYQALVLAQFAAILGLFVWICRPQSTVRGWMCCLAVSCLCGLPSSRILFGFWPLNHHSAVLLLVLLAAALALGAGPHWKDWLFFPVTLTALFSIEAGLLIVPLVVALRVAGAPGATTRAVFGSVAALACYGLTRLTLSRAGVDVAIYTSTGFGFSALGPEQLVDMFGATPWVLWLYNVSATLLAVVASEPRDGVFRFIRALMDGGAAPFLWFQVLSSLLTSLVVAFVLWSQRDMSGRDRLLVVTGIVLILCGSGLGFLYVRDRIGLYAGAGYALLVYVALSIAVERQSSWRWRRGLMTTGLMTLAGIWGLRSGELYYTLRDTAWDYEWEWTGRWEELGGQIDPPTPLLARLRAEALEAAPEDPAGDPAWSYALFERKFRRSP